MATKGIAHRRKQPSERKTATRDVAEANRALKALRAPYEQTAAERAARIAARREENARRVRAAHERAMAGFKPTQPQPMTFVKLARKHCRATTA